MLLDLGRGFGPLISSSFIILAGESTMFFSYSPPSDSCPPHHRPPRRESISSRFSVDVESFLSRDWQSTPNRPKNGSKSTRSVGGYRAVGWAEAEEQRHYAGVDGESRVSRHIRESGIKAHWHCRKTCVVPCLLDKTILSLPKSIQLRITKSMV